MTDIDAVTASSCIPAHRKHEPRPIEAGAGFASLLAQQIVEPAFEPTEPASEEPAEPTIELKARKSRSAKHARGRALHPSSTHPCTTTPLGVRQFKSSSQQNPQEGSNRSCLND